MQTDHYTYVETNDTGPKAEYSEIGVYSHLRENEERRNLTEDLAVYNHLKDSEEGREQGEDTYDRASIKKAAASDHGNSDHIYDQSSADVYREKGTESGLEGDEYHHTGLILTENTYDETKMSTVPQDLDGEYSHTQDLQTEHAYGKVDVHSGALDDEYCHTIDIETEQALQNYNHSQEVQIKKRES
ncbi:uncharacterized protein LOC134243311 [Saccostrea cucullata]|uniref:uncharacterized protein LOC134243311 n=1 Tax=Saccostrea cuccullata TaxID=36930 RepID=UPI002ECFDD63